MTSDEAGRDEEAVAARRRRDRRASYALRQENGAYCPLFLPLASSHAEAERVDVALRRVRQREAIGGRMAGVVEMQRLGGARD